MLEEYLQTLMEHWFEKAHSDIKGLVDSQSDSDRSRMVELHDRWNDTRTYTVGEVVRCGNKLYRCNLDHQAQPTWTPEDTPSLWTQILYRDGIRVITDPIPSTQPFSLGDIGWWGDALYRSLINGNVYTPEQYPAGWEAENDG